MHNLKRSILTLTFFKLLDRLLQRLFSFILYIIWLSSFLPRNYSKSQAVTQRNWAITVKIGPFPAAANCIFIRTRQLESTLINLHFHFVFFSWLFFFCLVLFWRCYCYFWVCRLVDWSGVFHRSHETALIFIFSRLPWNTFSTQIIWLSLFIGVAVVVSFFAGSLALNFWLLFLSCEKLTCIFLNCQTLLI